MDNIYETERTLKRLSPRMVQAFGQQIAADQTAWQNFIDRLDKHFPRLFELYLKLKSQRYDLFFHLENLLHSMGEATFERPTDLHNLDQQRICLKMKSF